MTQDADNVMPQIARRQWLGGAISLAGTQILVQARPSQASRETIKVKSAAELLAAIAPTDVFFLNLASTIYLPLPKPTSLTMFGSARFLMG